MKETNHVVISNKVIDNIPNAINTIKTTNININNIDKLYNAIKIDYTIEANEAGRLRYEFSNYPTHHIDIEIAKILGIFYCYCEICNIIRYFLLFFIYLHCKL